MASSLEPCVWVPGGGILDVLAIRSLSAAPWGLREEAAVLASD